METKKAVQFIILFALSYILLNGLYQYILWLYAPEPDVLTVFTASIFCNLFNQFTQTPLLTDAAILISYGQKKLVRIAEGCNGIAVITTFLSFAFAFKSNLKNYLIFIPIAIISILIINILRLYLLIEIKLAFSSYFDVFHTYIFPAIIYFITFLLMVFWVKFINRKTSNES
jgi:exosortase family protein XrtF